MARFEHMSDKELELMKKNVIENAEILSDDIDAELIRRKNERKENFYFLSDFYRDNAFRMSDNKHCAVMGCNTPSKWVGYLGFDSNIIAVSVCDVHIKELYKPRHKMLGNNYLYEKDNPFNKKKKV